MRKVIRHWLFSFAAMRAVVQALLGLMATLWYLQLPVPTDPALMALKSLLLLLIIALFWLSPAFYFTSTPVRLLRWHFRTERAEFPCPVCGYDIRITPHRCPECGTRMRWGIL